MIQVFKIKAIWLLLTVFVFCNASIIKIKAQPKREFRGAWIQCVNRQFEGLSTEKMQQTLTYQLDELKKDGVNAIIFQVRPECDALYQSELEPWSRFLTGKQGVAPSPYWDPLQWMIEQCHKRGMELHAWINPYRAKTKGTTEVDAKHITITHPNLCFDYDGLEILNPGIPQSRDYICKVVADIVTRYDIDGLHYDDYFYPYPVADIDIPDDQQYNQYNNGIKDRGDWRRYNVSMFVKQLYETVHAIKPWVKVGVSPFGIYRNKKSAAIGSETNGLQNYDQLYADILLWVNNGWVDYCVPQLYWEIGNKAADYDTLIRWWNQHAANRPLYIGEDIERTVKYADLKNPAIHQQAEKYRLHDELPHVKGTVLWYAKAAVDNIGNYGTMLRNKYWKFPALQPNMPFIDKHAPKAPKKLKTLWMPDGYYLFWTAPKESNKWAEQTTQYVVYQFAKGEKINTNDASHIVGITSNPLFKLPYENGKTKYTFVVTPLNRIHNEGKASKTKVKL
jgi:uncharacterized lipoprotein YddW (UPF0748 family)